jgi:hypothetical protein
LRSLIREPLKIIIMLKDEFKWYIENQNDLVTKYNGKFIVIKDKSVVGAYDSERDALFESEKKYGLGSFIIQKCTPGEEDYTQIFHSRVSFANY